MPKLIAIGLILLCSVSKVSAYGSGYSDYPMMKGERLVTGEAIGITSDDGGVGLQARYTHRLSEKGTLDAGAGFSGGDRDARFFVGYDHEYFPDYDKQPRMTIRYSYTNASEFNDTRNILSVAPKISKGFLISGHEAYPFFSLPLGLSLNDDNKTYETIVNANLGVHTKLPFEGLERWVASGEVQIDVKDNFTAFLLGFSYQFQ